MIFPKLFVSCTEIKGDNNNIKQQIDGQATTFVSDGSPGSPHSIEDVSAKGQDSRLWASTSRGEFEMDIQS